MIEKRLGLRLTPFTIALAYTLLGGLWVFFSDDLLAAYLTDPVLFQRSKIINAWVFIVLSSQLLYLLMRRREGAIQRSQDSLSRANRSLKVFSECNKVITWYTKEQELLKVICRIFVEVGGYRLAWVGFARQTPEKIVEPVAHWGHDDGYLQSLQVTWDDSRNGQGPAGCAIRTGKTTVVQNIMTQPEFRPWRQEALQNGYASAIALPLWNDHEVFGGLVILAAEAEAFNQEEIKLLEELSADLSYAINGIRFHAEQKVVKEENRLLAAVIEQASDGVLIFDAAGTTLYINPAFEAICGTIVSEAIGVSVYTLDSCKMNGNFKRALEETIRRGVGRSGRFVNQRADGGRYEVDVHIAPVQRLSDAEIRYVAIMREVTHEVQLEKQLRSAQKMEAIATLSGGIAHDFNNILAAIITNTEMTLDDVGEDNPLREHLQIVLKAGLRGKDLVKQILTISHQADQERQPVQVEKVVSECLLLLRASLPTTIEIRKVIADNLGPVPADPSQLHQVILNLCTNAADAMQDQEGILEVRLADIQISPREARINPLLHPGSYLKMSIKDTGCGMEKGVMERIFDPFYTTKGRGKGTGLGLSVVHGIVKSHGGSLTVESEVGKGSVFEVFLPRIVCVEPSLPLPVDLPARGGKERILLVDDEEDLVFAGKKMLERLGYDVVAGTDSTEMLKLFRAAPKSFDLVITDQTMPHLTGEMLAREMLALRADLPIILCSGMGGSGPSRVSLERARAVGIRELVSKPFEREEMTRVIRRLLD
ncbi:MAG: GAF domain-containing protein [Desulfuromonadales bacterium]|nr:GAF domain-containing protein [Desulfuromonadales bacterium]